MINKKTILMGTGFIGLAAMGTFFLIESSQSEREASKADGMRVAAQAVAPANISLSEESTKVARRQVAETATQSEADFNGQIWRNSEEAKAVLEQSGMLPGDLKGEYYLELDVSSLAGLNFGDTFQMHIPHMHASLTAEVDRLTAHPNGDRTIEANFHGMDRRNSAVITLGPDVVYARFSTPEGAFTLEALGNYAWIASRGDMVASHFPHNDSVSTSASDVAEPRKDLELDGEISPIGSN
ncbi:MAG: hypothetical protein OQJ89_16815 [Kangiellaceae bacterium]|nr:hypothetical protein [Kangiellaceae bacterium]MCW8998421.1 hypothetical protein [Kangiellaceae bacterium]MCW9018638.1 hypothetical protein [Kangiellaceae bacterium]